MRTKIEKKIFIAKARTCKTFHTLVVSHHFIFFNFFILRFIKCPTLNRRFKSNVINVAPRPLELKGR